MADRYGPVSAIPDNLPLSASGDLMLFDPRPAILWMEKSEASPGT
jgi:hypothetical protein